MDWSSLVGYWPFVLGMMATGIVSGIAAGLLGIGGGAVIVPALSNALLLMGYDPEVVQHVAVGTSLAIIIPTGVMSARAHHKRGALDMEVLKLWAPFIVVGTFVGGLMAGFYSGDVLRIVFAVMAFVIAANIIFAFQTRLMGHLKGSAPTHRISAFVVGYISSLMGIGGGSLTVPTLVAFGHSMHKAVGTSAAIGVAIALSGTAGFLISGWSVEDRPPLSIGYINLLALALVGVLAAVCAPWGAALAHRMDQRTLKYVFAAFLIAVGLNMLWKVVLG
ncbi:sulfite exporter TauE/SafE family protein [Devosia sp. XJ19-1]|uniref:Probable membrane transporter protein n=1 Tax=Devosia ureilytica TaxID=2952754 RepID=A0A9Q4FRF4_9HYPH|nr:sulfite exporter TauE/SafE family protein [Devosia ureilytica]MCP8883783.1 sulfite exporter TauE/SafE family protein [Devosia ureilytica]MCP8887391.1 sulfite exporter TauE/SafE family protein [Devosia ureilytica]